jgi:hypothetical protein
MKSAFLVAGVLFSLAIFNQEVEAIPYVSNLGDLWTEGGIGDIHALFPGGSPYGSDTASFTTGAGNKYAINSITLEFVSGELGTLNIQLFQQNNSGSLLVGSFGNPVVNPTPTQWPGSTTFINFSPAGSIILDPLSQYTVVISDPANSSNDSALLFTKSSDFTSLANWAMNSTISGNPFASGEHLVMAVDATPIPDQSSTAVLLIGSLTGLAGCRFLLNFRNVVPQRF